MSTHPMTRRANKRFHKDKKEERQVGNRTTELGKERKKRINRLIN